jgi:uncharacterized membrane protein YkvA (DUF1232 family)
MEGAHQMTELDSRCLDAFPAWLRMLGDDARALAVLLDDERISDRARRQLAAALNYLFKSLDLIPDGIEDLGYMDDAFVIRVAAAALAAHDAAALELDSSAAVQRLADEAKLVIEFLAEDYPRLSAFVQALEHGSVRGRSVDAIASEAAVRSELVGEVKSWASSYQAPTFSRDEKNLVKLRSFLSAKLPQ